MAHQHLGLAEIQGLAGLGELFDTLVVFENYPVDRDGLAADAGGLRLGDVSGRDATHYPLSLAAMPGERLQLRLDYRPDLFERGERGGDGGSAGAAAGGGESRRRTRPIGTARHSRLGASAAPSCGTGTTPRARCRPRPCRSCSRRRRRARPMRSRWCSRMRALSYGELDARSNQLAHHLRALGVGPEVVVGLCVERSLEMLVGLLGILKAGGAYLPLDPDYPAERLAFMLADARAPVLVTPVRAASSGCPRMTPASCASMPTGPPSRAQPAHRAGASALDPHNPAYVIYTSGSTGTPKGVGGHPWRHSPILRRSQIDRFAITSAARILQFASLELRRRALEMCLSC